MIIKAFLVGIHSSGSFRPGKPAEILGGVFINAHVYALNVWCCILYESVNIRLSYVFS